MTSNGGGWTLVVAKYEDSPVTNWNQGITPASFTAPTAAMLDNCGNINTAANGCDQAASNGFVLNTSQIPTHTQTAFGKGSNATFIGYSDFVYTTGDIAKTLLTNLKDGNNYHVHGVLVVGILAIIQKIVFQLVQILGVILLPMIKLVEIYFLGPSLPCKPQFLVVIL